MRKTRILGLGITSIALAFAVAACGGTGDSTFGDGEDPNNPNGTNGPEGGINGGGRIGPKGTGSECVSSLASTKLATVDLVFMVDRSGSMGNFDQNGTQWTNLERRWKPVTESLKSFFASPGSIGINASLKFFPIDATPANLCAHDYSQSDVSMQALGDGAQFISKIDGTSTAGGTPSLQALQGAIKRARDEAAVRSGDKAVVVYVTDGQPGVYDENGNPANCANNDTAHVIQAAKDAFGGSPSVPIYVIGVGSNLQFLADVAREGGTNSPFMIDESNPTTSAQGFRDALTAIRTKAKQDLPCAMPLPPPPDGKALDINAVNVIIQNADGSENVVAYNGDCAGGVGWKYDNTAAPTRIDLCPATCDTSRNVNEGQIKVAFGCVTEGLVK